MAHHKTVKGRIRFANGTSDLQPVSRRHVRAVNVAYLAAGHIAKLAHRRDIFQELVRGKLRHKPCAGHFGRDGAAGTNHKNTLHVHHSPALYSPVRSKKYEKRRTISSGAFALEVPTRFELVHRGFADLCLTAWLRHHKTLAPQLKLQRQIFMERITRLELATSTLARWRSTR